MSKHFHEVRDAIHNFVRLDSDERTVLDSRPYQRLRHIHQLALSYLVYPGASHKRFEHSLGVMELAGRVFDVVTNHRNITDEIRSLLPEVDRPDQVQYWRRVVRMAALCHDIGHLPFSHAAEEKLLPEGWNHERLSMEIIKSPEMESIWGEQMTPPLRTQDIVKLAVGPRKLKGETFSDWEAILSEIIVGDAFGVDRMDYLLRDSHHVGVTYGKFDHYRLIDTLRILPSKIDSSIEPALGVEEGGLHPAEALLLARYFMYSQVYFHPVRRIYDIHLQEFLFAWLHNGKFPTEVEKHLALTDNEITAAFIEASRNSSKPGHDHAKRIVNRDHFRLLYARNPTDIEINPKAATAIYNAAKAEFGVENCRDDSYTPKGTPVDFPVIMRDKRIVSSLQVSQTLRSVPLVTVDYIFISPDKKTQAERWLTTNRDRIIKTSMEGEI